MPFPGWLARRLPKLSSRRIVVVTGGRPTGKTTLVRRAYPTRRYVNLDSVVDRAALRATRTTAWARTVGPAVLDEAQKESSIFDKVKWAFDERQIRFTVMTGSARVLLLAKVKETMAGRSFLFGLWPLTASELLAAGEPEPVGPLLSDLLAGSTPLSEVLAGCPALGLGDEESRRREMLDHLAT